MGLYLNKPMTLNAATNNFSLLKRTKRTYQRLAK